MASFWPNCLCWHEHEGPCRPSSSSHEGPLRPSSSLATLKVPVPIKSLGTSGRSWYSGTRQIKKHSQEWVIRVHSIDRPEKNPLVLRKVAIDCLYKTMPGLADHKSDFGALHNYQINIRRGCVDPITFEKLVDHILDWFQCPTHPQTVFELDIFNLSDAIKAYVTFNYIGWGYARNKAADVIKDLFKKDHVMSFDDIRLFAYNWKGHNRLSNPVARHIVETRALSPAEKLDIKDFILNEAPEFYKKVANYQKLDHKRGKRPVQGLLRYGSCAPKENNWEISSSGNSSEEEHSSSNNWGLETKESTEETNAENGYGDTQDTNVVDLTEIFEANSQDEQNEATDIEVVDQEQTQINIDDNVTDITKADNEQGQINNRDIVVSTNENNEAQAMEDVDDKNDEQFTIDSQHALSEDEDWVSMDKSEFLKTID